MKKIHGNKVVRTVAVPITENGEIALNELIDLLKSASWTRASLRRYILKMIVHEGLFALADHMRDGGKVWGHMRFDLANGARKSRWTEWADEAAQIEAVLEKALSDQTDEKEAA